jgi:xanthosine utilization system XapX-like protein
VQINSQDITAVIDIMLIAAFIAGFILTGLVTLRLTSVPLRPAVTLLLVGLVGLYLRIAVFDNYTEVTEHAD